MGVILHIMTIFSLILGVAMGTFCYEYIAGQKSEET